MSEMIERVAEAIWRNNGEYQVDEDANSKDLLNVDIEGWRRAARAAIKAMLEPAEAMLKASPIWDGHTTDEEQAKGNAREVWQQMITAALTV